MGLTQKNDGVLYDAGGAGLVVTIPYGATPIDLNSFVADRAYRVRAITHRVLVAGTGGAATVVVKKVASATAIASGTALMQSSFDIVGVANTNSTAASLSATTANNAIAAGDCIGLDFTGTTTNATGVVCVFLDPA